MDGLQQQDAPPPEDRRDEGAPVATDASSTARTTARRGRGRPPKGRSKGNDPSSTLVPRRSSRSTARTTARRGRGRPPKGRSKGNDPSSTLVPRRSSRRSRSADGHSAERSTAGRSGGGGSIQDSAHDRPRGDGIRSGAGYFRTRGSHARGDNEGEGPPRRRQKVQWSYPNGDTYLENALGDKRHGNGKVTLTGGEVWDDAHGGRHREEALHVRNDRRRQCPAGSLSGLSGSGAAAGLGGAGSAASPTGDPPPPLTLRQFPPALCPSPFPLGVPRPPPPGSASSVGPPSSGPSHRGASSDKRSARPYPPYSGKASRLTAAESAPPSPPPAETGWKVPPLSSDQRTKADVPARGALVVRGSDPGRRRLTLGADRRRGGREGQREEGGSSAMREDGAGSCIASSQKNDRMRGWGRRGGICRSLFAAPASPPPGVATIGRAVVLSLPLSGCVSLSLQVCWSAGAPFLANRDEAPEGCAAGPFAGATKLKGRTGRTRDAAAEGRTDTLRG
ncbi:hypothetical protein THAOC_10251 [Thalassiosira oceanica]|uniref:Uncharacterized protein n=1 Tax=Thalassiosira oceanica TaxID=159749 RepID=K0T5F8_THAOC|nr:hypothetical protein THAOC_10251 [Thalassiosira oceanica]|eukprot:EJK68556.1 hypothetical protein THAOC_10251 [Thalassiosira oceanica]